MRILEGNQVDVLLNGDQIFPAMLQAIRSAKKNHHVRNLHLLVRLDRQRNTKALAGRARAGVKVHVLLDWIGSNKMDASQLSMEQAGVQVRNYHKPHLSRPPRAEASLKTGSIGQDAGVVDANDKDAFIAAAKTRQWDRKSLCGH